MTALLINPFSFQAISSEEGASALGARNLATLRTPEIDRADAVAQAYFATPPSETPRTGRLVYLFGPPGSGKTLAIQFLRRRYRPAPQPAGQSLLSHQRDERLPRLP